MIRIGQQNTSGSPARRTAYFAWLSLLVATSGAAQTPDSIMQALSNWRLTVQPHTMATGTRTAQAGDVSLNATFHLHVPPQCVGARRCPLVLVPTSYPTDTWKWDSTLADRYGMLALGTNDYIPQLGLTPGDGLMVPMPSQVDSVLRAVLRTYAVDPDKIALLATGLHALRWGHLNLDVFSRIAAIDPYAYPRHLFPLMPPANARGTQVQFFISGALEDYGLGLGAFWTVKMLRDSGYVVQQVLSLKEHHHRQQDYEAAWRWLADSWATPDPQARPQPRARTDSLPLLTPEALSRMLDFWHRFLQLPDSIASMVPAPVNEVPSGRKPFLAEVPLTIGHFPVTVWMTDMVKLAAHYPAASAALQAAGLSAAQHDAYRAALVSARATWRFRDLPPENANALLQNEGLGDYPLPPPPQALAPDPASVLGRNVAFLEAHRAEADALDWWSTDRAYLQGLWVDP